jgi:Protein of unknown function (DUF2971)
MEKHSNIVESFPLTVGDFTLNYLEIHDCVFYHYTTHAGLEGILRDGGLRATYRLKMNDEGEFDYARNLIYNVLREIEKRNDISRAKHSIVKYTRINLDAILSDSIKQSRAYCACLTNSPDQEKQWETYAEDSKGFAIGFNIQKILNLQSTKVESGDSYFFCAPVTYNVQKQRDLVYRLVDTGIIDLQHFANTYSQTQEDLTAIRDRITKEIFVHLIFFMDFIKAPQYSSEQEMRLSIDSNNGTFKAPDIHYFERGKESIPFIFIDLRDPTSMRIPIEEIKIGPKASFDKESKFIETLLDDIGYCIGHEDRPRITYSSIASS